MKKQLFIILIIFSIFSCSSKPDKNGTKNKEPKKINKNKTVKTKKPLTSDEVLSEIRAHGQNMPTTDIKEENQQNNTEAFQTKDITILPTEAYTDTDLKVQLPSGFFGEMQWSVNNKLIHGQSSSYLNHEYFKKGDKISFKATGKNSEYRANTIILNRAPRFISNKKDIVINNNEFIYHIKVNDPDNDKFKIEIVMAPEGYNYNPSTKTLSLSFNEINKSEKISFMIQAKDSSGDSSTQQFTIDLKMKKSTEER